jgi:hypothetical protein
MAVNSGWRLEKHRGSDGYSKDDCAPAEGNYLQMPAVGYVRSAMHSRSIFSHPSLKISEGWDT